MRDVAMSMSRFVPSVLVMSLLFGAMFSADVNGAQPPSSREADLTEVVLVGTRHFITDMPEGYTPGHLRALLKKVSPDLLAVEAPSNVKDPWAHAPYELRELTRPWAREQRLDAVPVGWYEPRYQAQLAAMLQAFQRTGKQAAYQEIERRFQRMSSRHKMTCDFMNSKTNLALWREYHKGLHRLYNQDTPWETWNARIVANIRRLCSRHRGKRIAVVFGAAHCYYFQDHLEKQKGIKVIPTARFLPLAAPSVQAETRPIDHLKALRLLNFQNYGRLPAETLARLQKHLEKVKASAELENDYHLFRGKLLLHRLRPNEAITEFEHAGNLDPATVSRFDGRTRLSETARVFAAIAKLRAGRRQEARRALVEVIKMEGTTPATRRWASQLLKGITDAPNKGSKRPRAGPGI